MPFKHVGDKACLRAVEASVVRGDMVLGISSHELGRRRQAGYAENAAKIMHNIYKAEERERWVIKIVDEACALTSPSSCAKSAKLL